MVFTINPYEKLFFIFQVKIMKLNFRVRHEARKKVCFIGKTDY